MKPIRAETFSLQVPEVFEETHLLFETARVATYSTSYMMQNPEFSVALAALSDYAKGEGESPLDCLLHLIHDFGENLQLLEKHTLWVAGHPGAIQEGLVDWAWSDKKARVHYFVGGVVLDDCCYLIRAYCEDTDVEVYRPLFLSMGNSLELFGDRSAVLARHEAALASARTPEPETVLAVPPFHPPAGGEGVFRVGGYDLALSQSTCQVAIPPDLQSLAITVHGNLDPDLPDYHELVAYEGEGLGFRLDFKGICCRGVPTGEFSFEYGRTPDAGAFLWDDGWEYSLEFTGLVTLQDGWLSMRGVLSKQYYSEFRPRQLELYYPLPVGLLEWSHYRFLSIAETEGMARDQVRYLQLQEVDFEILPESLLQFGRLRELQILSPSGLRNLDGLSSLAELIDLSVCNSSLEKLTEEIGALQCLKSLTIHRSGLSDSPLGLWNLPVLQRLSLQGNHLTSLPAEAHLPLLESLDLSNNELTTLPDWVARCPRLQTLNLEGNPWQSLPQALLDLGNLELNIDDRERLFDLSYPGAQGEGTVAWYDQKYFARGSQAVRHTLFFAPGDQEDYQQLGSTRFGGWPDLPQGMPYPRATGEGGPYEFIAQLDCAQLAPLQDYLPREGTLYFFLDHWENLAPLVFHAPDGTILMAASQAEAMVGESEVERYTGYKATAYQGWSLPYHFEEPNGTSDSELEAAHPFDSKCHHESNGYVFTQHESPEVQAALRLRGKPAEWTVLLKVASLGDFQWGDAGELFFVIHKSDLEKRDFRNIYLGLESS